MSTTTSLGLHKPDVNDSVTGDTIPELAENFQTIDDLLVDSTQDSGWLSMSAIGGGTIKYRKRSGVVYVTFSNVAASTGSWLLITQEPLPAGYRPAFDTRSALSYNGPGTANGEVFIDTDGTIKTYGSNASPYWHGSMAFPV